MLNTLLLALAVTGQSDYNLIVQEHPTPATAVHTSKGDYDDQKISALADARAKVRAYTKALADARAEVSSLTQAVAAEARPRARIQYYSDESPPALRETAPVVYEEVPVIRSNPVIRRVSPSVRSATYSTSPPVTYAEATPVTGESCYSSAYSSSAAQSVYSTPVVSAPVTYSMATPIIQAAPVTYSAVPIISAAPAAFESGVTVSRERTRVGLFGRVRQDRRSTSYGSAVPAAFGASPMTFAGATVCVGGT